MLPPGARLTSEPWLLPGTMSGSVILLQLGSELMSVDNVPDEGHTDAQGLGCYLWLCACPTAVPSPLLC